jgi:GntR family transcriptional regulator
VVKYSRYNDTILRVRMDLEVNFQSGRPLYRQIAAGVASLLAAGELAPGEQLPPVRELADQLGVNFNTVARAYRVLDEQGLISTQHGRGTFILARGPVAGQGRDLAGRKRRLTARYLEEMERLGSPAEEVVRWITGTARNSGSEE